MSSAIGVFLTAMSGLAGQVACCAQFTIFMGASTGAMLGSAAG